MHAWQHWAGWCPGELLPDLDQGFTELLDSLRCNLAGPDGPKHNEPEMFFGFRSGNGVLDPLGSPHETSHCIKKNPDNVSSLTICVTWRGLSVPLWLYRSDHHMATKPVMLKKVTGSTTFFLRVCHMCLRWTCGRPADSDIYGTSQSYSTVWGSDHKPL